MAQQCHIWRVSFLGRPVKVFINTLALVLLLLVGVVFVASPAQLMGTITMDVFGVSQGALVLGDAEAVHHSVEAGGIKVWGMDKATVVAVWTAIIFCLLYSCNLTSS